MRPRYNKRQFVVGQAAINQQKLNEAQKLQGKEVFIAGVARKVVGLNETTGEIEVQVGSRVVQYDPFGVTVV